MSHPLSTKSEPGRPGQGGRPALPRLLVATSNPHKVGEIAGHLADIAGGKIEVLGAGKLPAGDPPAETGRTFGENAAIKAEACALRALELPPAERPDWVVGDDSGLQVDALGGAPGVHSARFAGQGSGDRENNLKLLAMLRGVPEDGRGAEFVCVLAVVRIPGGSGGGDAAPRFSGPRPTGPSPSGRGSAGPPGVLFQVEGRTRGRILLEGRGAGGFGYDPLFLVPELGKTYAEISREEKGRVSHRGKALLALWRELTRLREGGDGAPGT